MNRRSIPFDKIKEQVSYPQVAQMLNIKLLRDSNGWRCPCSCGGGSEHKHRIVSINPEKGFQCYSCHQKGHDVIAFYSLMTGMSMYDAATDLDKRFGISTPARNDATNPRATSPERSEPDQGEATAGDVLALLGLSLKQAQASGMAYTLADGRLTIPLNLPSASLTVSLWDEEPLLQVRFEEIAKEEPKPGKRSLDDMRKLLRVVGG